ncbi:MAG: SDR family NAD(P)-dependent oxidoreductase [Halioglobus sp.]
MSRRILITGANKGIGLATVKAILEQDEDTHVLLGSRHAGRGAEAVAALHRENPAWAARLDTLQIDVADPESVAAARYAGEPTPLYGLVNNAGIGLGSNDIGRVLAVNTLGVKGVCDAFEPLLADYGRLVIVSSASGPNFVNQCSPARQAFFCNAGVEWQDIEDLINAVIASEGDSATMNELGLGEMNAYGFSKACVSLYTLLLARQQPRLLINACTPGYIATDLTLPRAEDRGLSPEELGMKSPEHGTVAIMHLLFGTPHGSGHYYGSDGKRSPMDRYRAPGDPEYLGDSTR